MTVTIPLWAANTVGVLGEVVGVTAAIGILLLAYIGLVFIKDWWDGP